MAGAEAGEARSTTTRKFTTVFAPTNDALDRLERERPWLFQELAGVGAAGVDGEEGGVGDIEGGGIGGEGGAWVPIRELLAYHLVSGQALFSR